MFERLVNTTSTVQGQKHCGVIHSVHDEASQQSSMQSKISISDRDGRDQSISSSEELLEREEDHGMKEGGRGDGVTEFDCIS